MLQFLLLSFYPFAHIPFGFLKSVLSVYAFVYMYLGTLVAQQWKVIGSIKSHMYLSSWVFKSLINLT